MKTTFSMRLASGYGHYWIIKTTPKNVVSKVLTNDSMLYDDFTNGKKCQTAMRDEFKRNNDNN